MNKVLISLCFSLLGSFALPANAAVKAIMEGVPASLNTILVSTRTGHVVVGSTTSLPAWTLTVSSNSVSTYAPYLALNAGSAGSPILTWAQNFSERAYAYYNNTTSKLELNRSGSSGAGLSINSSDAVQIGSGGTPLAVISTGTYTPTLTAITNVAASGVTAAFYYDRIGNIVHVSGAITVDATTGASFTQIDISLPIASNFTGSYQGQGQGVNNGGTGNAFGNLYSDATNDRMNFFLTPTSGNNLEYVTSFSYVIQ